MPKLVFIQKRYDPDRKSLIIDLSNKGAGTAYNTKIYLKFGGGEVLMTLISASGDIETGDSASYKTDGVTMGNRFDVIWRYEDAEGIPYENSADMISN